MARLGIHCGPPRVSVLAGLLLMLRLPSAAGQRPGPAGGDPSCATGAEGATLTLGCPSEGLITKVNFAVYGGVSGACGGTFSKGSCGADITAEVTAACVGQSECTVHCGHNDPEGCKEGVGPTCGCAFTSGTKKTPLPFDKMTDPCPGKKKTQAYSVTCNNTSPGGGGGSAPFVTGLRVNSLVAPLTIDDPRPHFSFKLDGAGKRGVASQGYEVILREAGVSAPIWTSGKVTSNRTTYIPLGQAAANLTSDKDYMWSARCYVDGTPTAWSNASFSTALMEQSDWHAAQWITSPGGDAPGQFASQMRKVFTLPASAASRGRLYLALPGYGEVFLNGERLDDPETGSRSLSQYDYRMLYHTYDCSNLLKPGEKNVLAIYVGLGWWGHPAVPPQATRFPFGPPTVKALLRVRKAASAQGLFELGTDGTWQQTQGPVIYDDEYNGQTYDARLETPGWTSSTEVYPTTAELWTPVLLAASQPKFTLNNTIMSSAAFQPIKVITRRNPEWMREPSPGVFVYDFTQNEPGWCKLDITCERGLVVQLRHAEVLQHPPYGPRDGNVYVGNLRSAKATDIYVCKGDPAGESVEFSFTQHGFRYVELTFPGATAYPAPSLETLTAINIRSAVDIAGDLTFSDELLQKVHHNYLWGQASNLMMVPSDCDNRDERFGWTGDSALTADEASVNFDLSSFYDNWARMIDDGSQDGNVPCWIPGGPGHKGGCDASWGSAFPSVVYAQFKWQGDVLGPVDRWPGLKRYIDTTAARVTGGNKTIKNINTGPGDWVPPPASPDNSAFKPQPKVNGAYSAGFSFVRDVGNVAEMAASLGFTADAAKYSALYTKLKAEFHAAWWDPVKKIYEKGGQTAHSLALALGCAPTSEIQAAAVAHLVADIVGNGNHTTCGIIGWRFQLEALSKNGHADLAYALLTQTTYPSIGYEILDPKGEPATTLWELWNSDAQGPSMNSRNHIMFGGNGIWLHTYLGGIDNAPDTIGYEHVLIAPPATLIAQAVQAASTNVWETQSINARREHLLHFDGATNTGTSTSSPPLTWSTATKQTPAGEVALSWELGNSTLSMEVSVPANTVATTVVPLVGGGANPTISEGGKQLWNRGSYVSGVGGVTSATKQGDSVVVEHGSGTYAFMVSGF